MKRSAYNLASDPRIDGRAFALRAGALATTALLLAGLAVANLARQFGADRGMRSATQLERRQAGVMRAESRGMQREIAAWKKAWRAELAAANRLIERKSFSFISRLDLLESVLGGGVRVLHLTLVNEARGRIAMTIRAESLRDLFALYKRLAPYDLAISNEVQTQGEYQVKLSFRIDHEKI